MPSEPEAVRRWLIDIRHHTVMAEWFVAGMAYKAFKDDNLRLYAVVRCIEIISEASRRLPDDLKARHPSVAWRDMAGWTVMIRGDGTTRKELKHCVAWLQSANFATSQSTCINVSGSVLSTITPIHT